MLGNLDSLLAEGIIDEILGRLKSGKEADVFRVVYRGQIVAAKLYKDREQRSFKHNAAYKEGRKVRNTRTQRAMDKGSRFGRDEAEDAWKSSEADTLHVLHAHGVRVPTPVMFYGGVLLMQLVTDAEGDIAPRLIEAPIEVEQAGALYRDVRRQIVGMLCCDLIHGDLSPYNVLLGAAGPTLIDFPQTLSAAHNSQSEAFFRRDFDNIFRFFAALDPRLHAHRGDAREIWRAYERRELGPDFAPSGLARDERRSPTLEARPAVRAHPDAAEGPRGQRPMRPQRESGAAIPQGQHRGHGPGHAPPRGGQRQPPRAAQSPVVVYVKRTGTRESEHRGELAPARTQAPQQAQPRAPHQTQPQGPQQAQGQTPPGEGGRRRRRRRK